MTKTYEWDTNFINEKLKTLEKAYRKKNLSHQKKDIIEISMESYLNVLDLMKNQLPMEKEENNDDKQPLIYLILHLFSQNIENLYQTYPYLLDNGFKKILVSLNKIEKQPNIELKKINTSEEEIINNVKVFYHNLEPSLYNEILKIEKRNPNCYQFFDYLPDYGHCIIDLYHRIPYIAIRRTNTLYEEYTLTHELIHSMEIINNGAYFSNFHNITRETLSLLIEMILHDYQQKNNLYNNETHIMNTKINNYILDDTKIVATQLKALNILKTEKEINQKLLEEYIPDLPFSEIIKILSIYLHDPLKNVISYYYAKQLFKVYQENPNELTKQLKQILTKRNNSDYLKQLFNTFDINTNMFNKHEKILVKN